MKLNEVIQAKVTSDELVDDVMDSHHTADDFDNGDLLQRIRQFDYYQLKNISIQTFNLKEWDSADWRVDDYVKLLKINPDYPPIIYDPVDKSIIDGIHRVLALEKSKAKTVKAYVGILPKRSFSDLEDDEEEDT